jgi:hypothetical protein
MQTYRILYLRENRLEQSEALPGLDLLEVIDVATAHVAGRTAEIWSDHGKVGIVAPPPDAVDRAASEDGGAADGAEINEEMRARLRLVP